MEIYEFKIDDIVNVRNDTAGFDVDGKIIRRSKTNYSGNTEYIISIIQVYVGYGSTIGIYIGRELTVGKNYNDTMFIATPCITPFSKFINDIYVKELENHG